MKFELVFLTIALPSVIFACKSVDELDVCAYEMSFLGNRNIKVPSNDAELLDMCGKAKKGIKCLKDDAIECMQGPLKSIVTKVFSDWENHFNTRCDSPAHRDEFLKHVQCFTDDAKADAIRLCADKHMVMMEKVSNLPKELVMGGACCTANGFRDCVVGQIKAQCSGESGDYFDEMIQEVMEENHQMMCNEYLTLDMCNAKYDAATWADLKAIQDSSDVSALKNHQYKTVIPIIIKMIKAASAP